MHSSPFPLPIAVVGSGLDEERRNAWRCYLAALPLRPPPASGGGDGEPPSSSSFPPPLRRPVPFLGSGYAIGGKEEEEEEAVVVGEWSDPRRTDGRTDRGDQEAVGGAI